MWTEIGPTSVLRVGGHPGAVLLDEQLEDFPWLGVAADRVFREENLTVDGHVEHALGSGSEGERADDVLVVAEDV